MLRQLWSRHQYLVYVDRKSGFPMIQEWNHDPASAEIIFTISEWFSTPSMPTNLHSYVGSQYVSREFQDFLTKWFVTWKPSSPYFAQSNGLAESSVIFDIFIVETRCSKYEVVGILGWIVWVSLPAVHYTPRADGRSPNTSVYGHQLQSCLVTHHMAFESSWIKYMDRADA